MTDGNEQTHEYYDRKKREANATLKGVGCVLVGWLAVLLVLILILLAVVACVYVLFALIIAEGMSGGGR